MRYLAVLAWPAGLALILGAGYLFAARAQAPPGTGSATARDGRRRGHRTSRSGQLWAAAVGSAEVICVASIGAAVVFGVMALLGLLVVHHGVALDKPIFTWMAHHQVHKMARVMGRLTKIGNTWTTWGAAGAAAACMAVSFRNRRWLPPVLFTTVIVLDHYTTLALRHVFHRLGPPTSPLGTYPSGGCDRVVVFYGLIGYLLWREFSGQRRAAVWTAAAVACLAFNEAYSRVYIGLHWFTDALSGVLYGALLLAVFITAVHVATSRVTLPLSRRRPPEDRPPAPADAYIAGGSSA